VERPSPLVPSDLALLPESSLPLLPRDGPAALTDVPRRDNVSVYSSLVRRGIRRELRPRWRYWPPGQ